MKYAILLLTASLSFNAQASDCHGKISLDEFTSLAHFAQEAYFPELKNETLVVQLFRSDAYFLQAQPQKKSLLKNRANRVYEVQLNPNLLDCSPGRDALISILTHELEHIVDYTQMSNAQIIKHAIKYSLSRQFRTRYERATDLKTLKKGQGLGLIQYREWIYPQLSSRQLSLKKRYYLTPAEIQDWMTHSN